MITKRRRWRIALGALVLLSLASTPWAWTELSARGHEFTESGAPAADVVIVLGTEVRTDGTPGDRLTGRLETAAALVQAGKARVILLSGDGGGASGDEPAAMARHLRGLGVDPCPVTLLAEKSARDYLACGKAAWDALRGRPPAVVSPASSAVHDALAGG